MSQPQSPFDRMLALVVRRPAASPAPPPCAVAPSRKGRAASPPAAQGPLSTVAKASALPPPAKARKAASAGVPRAVKPIAPFAHLAGWSGGPLLNTPEVFAMQVADATSRAERMRGDKIEPGSLAAKIERAKARAASEAVAEPAGGSFAARLADARARADQATTSKPTGFAARLAAARAKIDFGY